MAPKAFPAATAATVGLTRVVLKKAFFDSVDAIQALQKMPEDDLLRIISQLFPAVILQAGAEMCSDMSHLDRAIICVMSCNSFHSGYSQAIADLTANPPKNLHVEYEQQQRPAPTSPATNGAAAATPNRS